MHISVPTVVRLLIHSLLIALLLPPAPAAASDDETPGQGTLQGKENAGEFVPMPLRHTDVRVEVTGFVARVEVIQTFGNPFESAIEARYLFPLPERAAVDDFLLEVGERRIRGEIHRREEARMIYETARAAGYTASLLDQKRPNIFIQSVANIPSGKEVKVHLRYVDILPFADGAYRFLYPMVVGPRYAPARPGQATGAEGGSFQPSCLRRGTRSGNDIAITLDIDSGVPIRSLTSESHQIVVTSPGPHRARVALAAGDTVPNKDLMVRWEVAGEMPEVGVLAHRADGEGFFALLIQPKAEVTTDEAAPKEIIFVLDQSGSMSGLPIGMSKRFMRLALQTLGARDRFNIVRFDGAATVLAPEPLPNTPQNLRRGLDAVESMQGSGGTEMLAGFDAALTQPRDEHCIRIVFFLTDGFIGNEDEIFEVIRQRRGDARIFTLGVGSSVNHHLLRGMADIGHGAYQYIRPDGHEEKAVEQFQRWVTKPYLTDLEIDWGTLRVEDVQPSHLPDLYSGQTLSLVGRYLWGGSDTLIIRGRLGGVPWEKQVEVTLPERSESHAALASVWARQRIQDLLMQPGEAAGPEIEAQVTSLALAFRLMSPFTSFVAVDDSAVVNADGDPMPVDQPSPPPEFVSFEGCFGERGPGRAEDLEYDETVVIESRGNIVDTGNSAITVSALPIIGHNYRNILTIAPGVTDGDGVINVHGLRDTGLQYRTDGGNTSDPVSGTFGQNLPGDIIEEVEVITAGASAEFGRADGGFSSIVTGPGIVSTVRADGGPRVVAARQAHQTDATAAIAIEEAALRVIADLADDGRLTRSEGLPALAGLLEAQYANGGFVPSLRVQALATWALAAAAVSEPRLRWAPEAARMAVEFLARMRSPCASIDPGDEPFADLVLGMTRVSGMPGEPGITIVSMGRCFDARQPLELVRKEVGSSGARLVDRILGRTDGPSAPIGARRATLTTP